MPVSLVPDSHCRISREGGEGGEGGEVVLSSLLVAELDLLIILLDLSS